MRRCKLPAYNWRWRRHNAVPFVTYQEYSDGVGPSPKGGPEPARPPSKSATGQHHRYHKHRRHCVCVSPAFATTLVYTFIRARRETRPSRLTSR